MRDSVRRRIYNNILIELRTFFNEIFHAFRGKQFGRIWRNCARANDGKRNPFNIVYAEILYFGKEVTKSGRRIGPPKSALNRLSHIGVYKKRFLPSIAKLMATFAAVRLFPSEGLELVIAKVRQALLESAVMQNIRLVLSLT